MFCCTFLYVHSSFAIILIGKRELVALLSLSIWCLVIVAWLFLTVPLVCLQFMIVVFSDHTHNFCLTVAIVTDALLFFMTGYLHTQYDPDKMSKSLKNTISIQDLLEKYSANQFRMFCMLTGYRHRKFTFFITPKELGRHIVIALSVCSSVHTYIPLCVRYISPIFFEVGIPNLVCGYILGWLSVAYHFRVTVTLTLTSDLVFRIIVSGAYLFYYLR